MSLPIIRPYQSGDEKAVRGICCDTALYGQPIDLLLSDRKLVSDALLNYYLRFEPASTFVAEAGGKVVGYLTGCLETRRFERVFASRTAPHLIIRFLLFGSWLRPHSWQILSAISRGEKQWSGVRESVLKNYPAHLHTNLATGFRQSGTGSALLQAFFEHARRHRVKGAHIVTATDSGKRFFGKAGFQILTRYLSMPLAGVPSREVWVMGRPLGNL